MIVSYSLFFNRKTYFWLIAILPFVFGSCKQSRQITSYVVSSKLIERIPGQIDTIRAEKKQQFYDKKNESYLEIGVFHKDGEKKLVLSSDVLDKKNVGYDKISYLVLDSVMVNQLQNFYSMIDEPRTIYNEEYQVEFALSSDVFIALYLDYDFDDAVLYLDSKEKRKNAPTVVMDLWMFGRKHRINHEDFFKAITLED